MRDRLIELLEEAKINAHTTIGSLNNGFGAWYADHLLANGVIVPPCKVMQTVWFIRNQKIIETKVDKIVLKHGGLYIKLDCNSIYETSCNSIGKTVFLTREEAERALKGSSENV